MKSKTLIAFAVLCCVVAQLDALNFVSNTLGSHMVLQRAPQQARIWGWTKKGDVGVSVTLDNGPPQRSSSRPDGKWVLSLWPPQPAGGPHTLSIKSEDGETAMLEDVWFGDVYICSGQSNMQMTVASTFNASEEIKKANNYPQVRLFTVGQGTISQTPLEELATIEQPWSVADSRSVGFGEWTYFSSLCWFFGRDLYDLYHIPIGLVSTNWGGTFVQAWSSSNALAKCKQQKVITSPEEEQQQEEEDLNAMATKDNPNQNSVLYNAMIVPYLEMRIRGGIWYQGESNVGNAKFYGCAFPEMIKDWRDNWGYKPEEFPFFFIQLAAYTQGGPYGSLLAELRYSQTKALALPYVGMATAVDLGDLASPAGNIHPRNKQALGYRSTLLAKSMIYGEKDVIISGPVAVNYTVLSPGPTSAAVRIAFEGNTKGDYEPVLHDVFCPSSLIGTKECGWYEILGSDNVWVNATASLATRSDGTFLDLRANLAAGAKAMGARYGYSDWPVCTLFNKFGLPAPPFIFPAPF